MAVFANLLFGRTLKQFLACKDLESSSGQALTKKIQSSAKNSLERILEIIPRTPKPHSDVLKKICENEINRDSEDRFLNNLESDTTQLRLATKNLLGSSTQINPSKLFQRLHETNISKSEIIDILDLQQKNLQPELYVKNALKMEKGYASRLFDIARANAGRTDMSSLSIDIESIENPEVKIMLIRFLGAVNQPQAADMILQFLGDKSKVVVIEALKNLKNMTVAFNPAPVARFIPEMREQDVQTAFEVLQANASADTLPALAELLATKNEQFKQQASQIVARHVTTESLEALLLALDKYEWWSKEQAINSIFSVANKKLDSAAFKLLKHENEFIRNTANQLSAGSSLTTGDITGISKSIFNDDWQIRERAIQQIGQSGNKSALTLLNKVIDVKPESSIAVLKAVSQLGFSKGLEITSKCLLKKEAAIQREALLTTSQIVTQRHADSVRNGIIKIVPNLQATVRDTALEVINEITLKFNLPKLNLDEDDLFETRLIKIEENKDKNSNQTQLGQPGNVDKTEVVPIEKLLRLVISISKS